MSHDRHIKAFVYTRAAGCASWWLTRNNWGPWGSFTVAASVYAINSLHLRCPCERFRDADAGDAAVCNSSKQQLPANETPRRSRDLLISEHTLMYLFLSRLDARLCARSNRRQMLFFSLSLATRELCYLLSSQNKPTRERVSEIKDGTKEDERNEQEKGLLSAISVYLSLSCFYFRFDCTSSYRLCKPTAMVPFCTMYYPRPQDKTSRAKPTCRQRRPAPRFI